MIILHNDYPPYRSDLFDFLMGSLGGKIYLPKDFENFRKWQRPLDHSHVERKLQVFFGQYILCWSDLKVLMNHTIVISNLTPRFLLLNLFLTLFYKKKLFFISGLNSDFSKEKYSLKIIVYYWLWYTVVRLKKTTKFFNYTGPSTVRNFSTIQMISLGRRSYEICITSIKHVVFVGYIRKGLNKGLDTILELVKRYPEIKFHVCSNETINYPNVVNYGIVTSEKRDKIISFSDLLIVPSKGKDPWNWTAVEAVIQGTPVLATQQVGFSELLPIELVSGSSTEEFINSFDSLTSISGSWTIDMSRVCLENNKYRLMEFLVK